MNILFLLIGVSLLAALIFLALFIWAVRNGQYDDNYTPSVRVLFDDEENQNLTDPKSTHSIEKSSEQNHGNTKI